MKLAFYAKTKAQLILILNYLENMKVFLVQSFQKLYIFVLKSDDETLLYCDKLQI